MNKADFTFRVEMRVGQDQRRVDADNFGEVDGWLIFYRRPPQGGIQEHWRARLVDVVSMETVRNV